MGSARIKSVRQRIGAVSSKLRYAYNPEKADPVLGKPGVTRKERLRATKEYNKFKKDNPISPELSEPLNVGAEAETRQHIVKNPDLQIQTPDDIIRYDEEHSEGIPPPRVEGFSKFVPTKHYETIPSKWTDRSGFGRFHTTGEPVNVDKDYEFMDEEASGIFEGESVLNDILEDKRRNRKRLSDSLPSQTLEEKYKDRHLMVTAFDIERDRRISGLGSRQQGEGNERIQHHWTDPDSPPDSEYGKAVISRPNAKRWAKSARIQMARERLAGIHAEPPFDRNWRDRIFSKSFMYEEGELEDVVDFGQGKLKGYGVGYSHPRHLNMGYGTNIKSFKDMDNALDELKLMRVTDDSEGRKINIGNKATPKQLEQIRKQFETHDKPVLASITSISRKRHKTYDDFLKAYNEHSGQSAPDVGDTAFKTHTQNLAGKLRQRIAGLGFRERILNWLKEQPRFKSFDPDSSFVGTVKYDQDNQTMQIELNGKKYDFCNVEERLFDSFSGAGSKGAFFNREIKSLHNCGAW